MSGIFMRIGDREQVIKIHTLKTLQILDQNKKIAELWDSDQWLNGIEGIFLFFWFVCF